MTKNKKYKKIMLTRKGKYDIIGCVVGNGKTFKYQRKKFDKKIKKILKK